MRTFGCLTCGTAWAESPLLEPDGSHFSDAQAPCSGAVVSFLPEAMVGTSAADVLRAEAIRDAAIWRAEAVASQAQRAIADLYWEQKTSGRAAVRAYRNVLRLERLGALLTTSESAPMAILRALLACESLLDSFARRRPCPSCRGGLDHRRLCRLARLMDRIALLTSERKAPQKIRRSRRAVARRRGA